jgi:hypothetical protein
MFYRAVIVFMFATAVGTLLVSRPGALFKNSAQMSAERNLFETDHDAQMIELRERAHAAMVRLQSLQAAPGYVRISDNK